MAIADIRRKPGFLDRFAKPLSDKPLAAWRLAAFALPSLPLAALHMPITIYLPAFYTQEMGIGMAMFGFIYGATKIWDVFTDPLIGIISDRYPTRFGRRRHWLVLSVPILMIGTVLVMMPQYVVGDHATPLYLLASFLLLYVGFTFATVAQTAWAAELSADYHERSRIMGWREIVMSLGMFTVLSVPFVIEWFGDATDTGGKVEAMGWYGIVLIPITVFIAVTVVGERRTSPPKVIGYREAFMALVKNPHLLRIAGTDILLATPMAILGALFVFFIKYVVQAEVYTIVMVLAFYVGHVIAVPIWMKLGRYISKHRAVGFNIFGFGICMFCFFFVGKGGEILFATISFISALLFGGASFLLRSITADITDYDNLKSGSQRTGLLYSVLAMTAKTGPALAIFVTFPLLAVLGFDPAVGDPSPEAIAALRYVFVLLPVGALVGASILIFGFELDETAQRELRRQIDERDENRANGLDFDS